MGIKNLNVGNIKKDLWASLVVFLVALPLCIGVAIASGLPPETGILSGIIGGIVVGIFSGSPLQVSGPAAGLIIIVYEIVQKYGIESLGIIILTAGIIQIVFGLLSWGKWFRAISPAIVQGMLSGIGISILLSQFYIMLDTSPQKTVLDNILHLPKTIIHAIFPFDASTHHLAASIGLLTISIIFFWKYIPKKYKLIPATLIAVSIASAASFIFDLPIKYITISENIFSNIHYISIEQFKYLFNIDYLIEAIGVAFIASAETLLTSTAIDKMADSHKTDYNKEIFAQGVGNTLAGLIGAIPITGVIVRSAANIQAGAKSRVSAIMHGVWILLFVTTLPFIFKFIPAASLAAILVYTGFKLVNIQMGKTIYNLSKGEFAIYLVTILAILSTNLLEGILIGLAAGVLKNLYKTMKFKIKVVNQDSDNKVIVKITGNLTFLRLPQIAEVIENIKPGKCVQFVFERISIADHAIIDLILGWSSRYIQNKGSVLIDWDVLKRIYPDFGWDSLNTIYPEMDSMAIQQDLGDCPQCGNNSN
ncbi:MAG: SulP family inorganic anion transporter [bacterium]